MKFDRKIFYDEFRKWRGVVLPQQVKGLNFLLDCIESDPYIERIDWAAYMLATTMHETAFTFMPVHEYGSHKYFVGRYGSQTKVGRRLGNDTPEEGYDYAGKGFPQTTGEDNYEKAEIALRREYPALVADFEKRTGKTFDLTVGDQPDDKSDPQNMLNPRIAYAVMSYGMRSGMFTGTSLKTYFNQNTQDWDNARRIINGMDKAQIIGKYGQIFYAILKKSIVAETDRTETSETSEKTLQPASPESNTDAPVETTVKKETETPAGTTSVQVTEQAGDKPEAEPKVWFSVEDWKGFVFRNLKRVWKFFSGVNAPQLTGFSLAAIKDPPHWFIYLAIGFGILIVTLIIAAIISGVLLLIWYFNRREIKEAKQLEHKSKVDPNSFNLGLIFEKL